MKRERLTVKNPDGTYRIWMERAGTFRLESQMDSVFAYGDLVNKLGRYEDQDEERHKKQLLHKKQEPVAGWHTYLDKITIPFGCQNVKQGGETPPVFLTKNQNWKGRGQALFGLDKDIKDRTGGWEQSVKNIGFVGEISWK